MDPIEKHDKLTQEADSLFNRLNQATQKLFKPQQSDFANAYVDQHRKDLESGAECQGLKVGDKPNDKFWSAVGSIEAIFGRNRNKVDDIGELDITKRELRCYDTDKDIYNIEWLYDNRAKYHAKKIWGNPKEGIHFLGEWYPGAVFKGIWEGPVSDFKAAPLFFKDLRGISLQQVAQLQLDPEEYLRKQKEQEQQAQATQQIRPTIPMYYWYEPNGVEHGPLNFAQLKQAYTSAGINKQTLVWRKGIKGDDPNHPQAIYLFDLPEFNQFLPE